MGTDIDSGCFYPEVTAVFNCCRADTCDFSVGQTGI